MPFHFEDQVLDPVRRELSRNGQPVPVEPKVFDLLVYLIENQDRLVTKDDLIAHVWSGRIVSDSALTSAINAARTAVGDSGREQRLIRTSARKGFRFVGDVSSTRPPQPQAKPAPRAPADKPSAGADSRNDIAALLTSKGLAKYIDAFQQNDIDFDVLQSLGDEDLKQLGLSLGNRRRLMAVLAEIAQGGGETPDANTSASALGPVPERRQLTVVFVDLVESAARPQDPEELRDLMRFYHPVISDVICEAGGFIAKFIGNGMLAYFGYPYAIEDAAERAVRAGLQAIALAKSISYPKAPVLAARVGVATGAVVVSEGLAREVDVIGEPATLATHLPALGPTGSVVIADSTRRLIGELFSLEKLLPRNIKGVAERVLAFQVMGERQILSRFEAIRGSRRSLFVGRNQEVSLLLDRWQQAKAGDGQLVLLSGEAGIGKSRIIETIWQKVAADTCHRILYQCTSQHVSSALYPALTQLAAVAELQPEDGAAARATKVRAVLPDVSDEQCTLVASLLGVPIPDGSPLLALTPTRKRQLMLDAFLRQLEAQCRQRPVMWVVEDTHWIDPTTEELISHVVARAGLQRLLIVLSHRTEYKAPWSSTPIATQLVLNRLSPTQAGVLLEALAGNKAMPAEALEYINARTDGVPLFMEELFQALCDSGTLRATEKAYEVTGALEGTAVPTTLQDSLMARLDRLAHGKAVAQLGAAIGREFEHEQLSSIADMQPEILGEGLRQLLAAGLVFSRGAAPDATYTFKHALVQDAAYGSMLRQRRQEVHGRIARELVERAAGVRPELIAHHFEAAGKLSEAVEWLETAGDAAVRSAASQEAIRFWRRALQLLSGDIGVKDTPRRQIQLMQKLASTFIQVEGYGSTEAFELGEAALRVANETKNLDLYIRVSTANAPTLFPRQDYERVERQLAHVSERDLQTVGIASQTHYWSVRGITDFHLGRFAESLHNLVRALSLGDAIRNSESSFGGGDVRFVARSYLARAELIFGLRDTATATAEDALVTARQLADPFSIAWGLVTLGRTHLATGKYKKSILALDESVQLCERYGYIARLGQAFTLRGSVKAVLGEAQAGMNEIEKGIELWRRSAGIFSMDILLTEAAHYLSSCGGQELARRLVQDAKRIYEIGPERAAYPECLRLEGVFTALDGNAAAAHKKLREAIKAAEMQAANSYRLRAAYDLARMLVDDGDKRGARNILAPAYSWFTEGFDAPDVVQAKTLLDELTG